MSIATSQIARWKSKSQRSLCILCEDCIEHWLDIYEQLLFLSLSMSHSRNGQSQLSLMR